jgi:hypothetical protein
MLYPNLCCAKNMPGGVQREAHPVDDARLAVRDANDPVTILAQPMLCDRHAGLRHEIVPAPAAQVIAMGMGDNRTVDRAPRIDVDIGGLTPEASVGELQKHREGTGRCYSSRYPHRDVNYD